MENAWYCAGAVFGGSGTYAKYPLDVMPVIDVELRGTFAWLPSSSDGGLAYLQRVEYERSDAADLDPTAALLAAIMGPAPVAKPEQPGWAVLDGLVADAEREGLQIPPAMLTFMSTPAFFESVPTCTDCYLDLSRRLLPGPTADTRLLRFLNDQQCSLVWYVLLERGGGHSVVAASPEWSSDAHMLATELDETSRPTGFVRCAASFEELVYRLWIEDSIWYAEHRQPARELTVEQQRYASTARANLARL